MISVAVLSSPCSSAAVAPCDPSAERVESTK